MIIIKLEGGLGNQMFQYAFATILAKRNDSTLLIDANFFKLVEKKPGFTPRNFELNIFDNNYVEASKSKVSSFFNLTFLDKIKRKLGLNHPKIYNERFFGFNQTAMNTKKPAYLKGYFQSYQYFNGYESLIKKVFSFPLDGLDYINSELLSDIKSMKTISIHVRRGDYVQDKSTQQFHGNCSLEYYFDAISLLVSKNKDSKLIFFSDDSEWVKEQFQNLQYQKIFIDHNKNKNCWKDMFLMSSCNHNIIANSSFSWWAAWLNENPHKTVIAPKNWFVATEKNTNYLIPTEWIRL